MFPHFVLILDCMAKTPFTFTKCSQKLIKGNSMIKEKNIFLALQNWQIWGIVLGYNLGFNFAMAMNFATDRWLKTKPLCLWTIPKFNCLVGSLTALQVATAFVNPTLMASFLTCRTSSNSNRRLYLVNLIILLSSNAFLILFNCLICFSLVFIQTTLHHMKREWWNLNESWKTIRVCLKLSKDMWRNMDHFQPGPGISERSLTTNKRLNLLRYCLLKTQIRCKTWIITIFWVLYAIIQGIKLTHTMAVTSSLKKKEINGRLVFFIGPKSNHCLPLELTNSQTDSCCWDLYDMTLADEDDWRSCLSNVGNLDNGPDYEAAVQLRFWSWILITLFYGLKRLLWKENSTLGSVHCQVQYRLCSALGNVLETAELNKPFKIQCLFESCGKLMSSNRLRHLKTSHKIGDPYRCGQCNYVSNFILFCPAFT